MIALYAQTRFWLAQYTDLGELLLTCPSVRGMFLQ